MRSTMRLVVVIGVLVLAVVLPALVLAQSFSKVVNLVPYGAFPAKDGSIIVACLTNSFWGKICKALGCPENAADEPGEDAVGVTDEQARLAGQTGIDHLIVARSSVELGEDDGGHDDIPVESSGRFGRSPNLAVRPGPRAGEDRGWFSVVDDGSAHPRRSMYLRTSDSSGGPCSTSSASRNSPRCRWRRRRISSTRMASLT